MTNFMLKAIEYYIRRQNERMGRYTEKADGFRKAETASESPVTDLPENFSA
jgi:hypothetical protein